jgi:uncharacterized protein YbjT (DUF2867 family)
VRLASRSTAPTFDWHDERTWAAPLAGVGSVYITYYPDLALPGAAEQVRRFTRRAVDGGVGRIVLLAGRGEPHVLPAEQAVRASGVAYTILECAFFSQNFSEGWLEPHGDVIAFPAGDVDEPFVDCDDIADVAALALTDDTHAGKTYELTGPRLLSFADAALELSQAMGRTVRYVPLSFEQYAELLAPLLPPEEVSFFIDLFRGLLDGHNAKLADGVERALGRKPRDFGDYARAVANGSKP